MWEDLFKQPIVINEDAFIAHYNRCLNNVFERILTKVAASGLSPDDFLEVNSQAIVNEVQSVKAVFMQMLHFPDEANTEEFGLKLSKIMLQKLHVFTYKSMKMSVVPGYN